MKKYLSKALCVLILLASPSLGFAKSKKGQDPIYRKLFPKSKELTTKRNGQLSIHHYQDKIYLELPQSYVKEREFLLRTIISKSSQDRLVGALASPNKYIRMERVGDNLLYKEIVHNIKANAEDEAQLKALQMSKGEPIFYKFPIKGYTKDSVNLICDVSNLYSPMNRDLIQLRGMPVSPVILISNSMRKRGLSYFNRIEAYPNALMVSNTLSASVGLSFLGLFNLGQNQDLSLEYDSYLVLLPKDQMAMRTANNNVGTGITYYYDYRPAIDTKFKKVVTKRRWAMGDKITFYIDPAIPESWRKAIAEASQRWNDVFESKGLGRPMELLPYPKEDKTFNPENPNFNVIALSDATRRSMQVSNLTDPRSGEIISSKILVSRNAAAPIQRMGMVQLGAVDERFRSYTLPESALCETLRGIALRNFGYTLGLVDNMAGSYAYSPKQIRSAEFTRKNGFTASVMDDVLFNTLALQGDKQKGVSLIVDKVGTADALAIEYLYRNFSWDKSKEDEELQKLVLKHEGDPRYLYIGEYSIVPSDPRGQWGDLGNDPITLLQNRTKNIKYVARNVAKWLADDNVPYYYKGGIPDYLINEYYSKVMSPLFAYVGGFYINDVNQRSKLKPYTMVPAGLQREVVKELIKVSEDISWLNKEKAFLQLAGANSNVTEFIAKQGLPMRALMQRLKYLPFSESKMSQPYRSEEFQKAIEDYLFTDISRGKKLSPEKFYLLKAYYLTLLNMSPTLKAVDKAVSSKRKSFALAEEEAKTYASLEAYQSFARTNLDEENSVRRLDNISFFSLEDRTPFVYKSLKRLSTKLQGAKRVSSDKHYRAKLDYYLEAIDRVIKPSK